MAMEKIIIRKHLHDLKKMYPQVLHIYIYTYRRQLHRIGSKRWVLCDLYPRVGMKPSNPFRRIVQSSALQVQVTAPPPVVGHKGPPAPSVQELVAESPTVVDKENAANGLDKGHAANLSRSGNNGGKIKASMLLTSPPAIESAPFAAAPSTTEENDSAAPTLNANTLSLITIKDGTANAAHHDTDVDSEVSRLRQQLDEALSLLSAQTAKVAELQAALGSQRAGPGETTTSPRKESDALDAVRSLADKRARRATIALVQTPPRPRQTRYSLLPQPTNGRQSLLSQPLPNSLPPVPDLDPRSRISLKVWWSAGTR